MSGSTIFAKELRKRSTDAERLLWSHLRAGRFHGLKFRRQHPIGDYIVDFVCLQNKFIIELDGGQHAMPDHSSRDQERAHWLEKEGYTIIRFWNNDVLTNTSGVLESLVRLLQAPSP
ncbi:MAG TPA: endonuclease domain-containing protein [Syntrophorhabdaceae bacterium]|nr:endonuclease domain-containing protein [Syntrophorhabdaceae bacterium]